MEEDAISSSVAEGGIRKAGCRNSGQKDGGCGDWVGRRGWWLGVGREGWGGGVGFEGGGGCYFDSQQSERLTVNLIQ